ncbi:MAG: hypothetical protein Q4D45_14140 [Lachnospiraceae bacterium]|nr:hypothetical protein [Lachnospiraceae bacterium]
MKKKVIIIVVVAAAILAVVFATNKEGKVLFSGQKTEESSSKDTSKGTDTAEDKNEKKKDDGSKNDTGTEKSTDKTKSSSSTEKSTSKKKSTTEGTKVQDTGETFGKKGSLPYTIPDTSLQIQKIAGYKGVFIEDGSDKKVSNVTAIALKNTGKEKIEYADITVKRGKKKLEFKASAIKAGATVVVQEANKTAYKEGTYSDCQAQVAYADEFEMSKDKVKVTDNGDNSLTVKNISKKKIVSIRIFYKYYMKDEKAYVGGITYNAKVEDLGAGKSIKITPSHYVSDSSKIMMVRTYDEKN